jgi:hypothetical protein
MPSLKNPNLENLQAGSHYSFSATKMDRLLASKYTLATIIMDASSSVLDFAPQLENALKTIFKACEKSDYKNTLMLRVTQFNDTLQELQGFKLLTDIKEDDFTGMLNIGGSTALYDAMDEGVQATSVYGSQLISQDYKANAIIVVVTDGQSNTGRIQDPSEIKKAVLKARKAENLESILTILVGVTNDDNNLDTYLTTVKDGAEVDQYISIGKATPGKIAKLAEFVSQSITSTSAALGSGGPSQPLTF